MKRSVAIVIWFVINIIYLSILRHYHKEYLNGEYVVKGRGGNARIITKQEDPEYYQSRMKYMWMGYILLPVLFGGILYFKIRQLEKKRSAK